MAGTAAAWHMSDSAKYDVTAELANILVAHLLSSSADDEVTAEITALHNALHAADPGDAAAIDALRTAILERIEELSR